MVLLLLYVDDILVAASNAELAAYYSKRISDTFRVSSEGPLTNYLGFDIMVDLANHRVSICMSRYVEKMFERFKMVVKQSVVTPLQEGITNAMHAATEADAQFQRDFEFREKVGCILYYMICMRPDICFAVGLMAKQCNRVTKAAAAGVTQLLQFCYNTRFEHLVLGGTAALAIAFADSDWATDRNNRKSQSYFILYLGLGPVEWKSSQQKQAALSTAEAELYAKVDPCKSIIWLRMLLTETTESRKAPSFFILD